MALLFIIMIWFIMTAPQIIFMAAVMILLFSFFSLLGGTLTWLNQLEDMDYCDTGMMRRMASADGKMLIFGTLAGLWVTYNHVFYYSGAENMFEALITNFNYNFHEYKTFITTVKSGSIEYTSDSLHNYMYIVLVRGFLLSQIIHAIHHLIINMKLAGVELVQYPRFMKWFKKMTTFARK